MVQIGDERLVRYIDGELTDTDATMLAETIAADDQLRMRYDRLWGAREGVRVAFETAGDSRFSERVVRRIASGRNRWSRARPAVAAAVATLVFSAFWLATRQAPSPPELAIRGGAATEPVAARDVGIEVYLHPASDPVDKRIAADGMTMKENDGFSFLMYNRTGRPTHLMLLGRDAAGALHWFYPMNSEDGPRASVEISAEPAMRPLPDGVTPEAVPAGPFRIIALFTDTAADTKSVADALDAAGTAALKSRYPESVVQVLTLQVERGEVK